MKRTCVLYRLIIFTVVLLLLSGCGLMDRSLKKTVDPETGSVLLAGLKSEVTVSRDNLGIPVIEAQNTRDLSYATGYVMASDRLVQMVTFSLLAQGRLSEMVGPVAVDMDIYMRTMGLARAARIQYGQLPEDLTGLLSDFADGVNAYINSHSDRLSLDFKISGYIPKPWQPMDCLYISSMLNLGLSFNIREEIIFLNLAAAIGPQKAAWLFPVSMDEPLPFDKAAGLKDIDWNRFGTESEKTAAVSEKLARIFFPTGIAASNNWAIGPSLTASGKTIVANDTHLPLEHPPIWMLLQVKCPEYHAAGIAMAGVPGIVAGYNGHIAWGETMVMGDGQDVFIEDLRKSGGKTEYLYKGKWFSVTEKKEIFHIKGEKDRSVVLQSTRHGTLLNTALAAGPKHFAIPQKIKSGYGLAVSTVYDVPTRSFEGMYGLNRAVTMDEARNAILKVKFMDLNFVYGDADNIGWQVSGTYPLRKKGRGHLPSPGWTGEYDWDGLLPVADYPHVENPGSGFLCTANNRTIGSDDPRILGSSWYAPWRVERISSVLSAKSDHAWKDSEALQADRLDIFFLKFKSLLFDSPLGGDIQKQISGWTDEDKRADAKLALSIFSVFDGNMQTDSSGAALWGIFQKTFIHDLFGDELGPEKGELWKNFSGLFSGIYGPDEDHLLGRQHSPFWDNVRTKKIETKADIIADSLADAVKHARNRMGSDPEKWQWGNIHTYEWRTTTTQMMPFLPFFQKCGAWLISKYTDRGPYPAGGDFDTVNVAGFHKTTDFDVWLIPAMRMIVDFSRKEPLFLVNSGGQSANPASSHYDDGIAVWLSAKNRQMPFTDTGISSHYKQVMLLKPR
ncbi:MAG: penicillin acylase family protein [Deltaproteobacteria bacterium]|nr:penicillin acylase family protein [Deltaproteobacteria bacterium]